MKLATVGTSAITQLMLDSIKDVTDIEPYASYSRNLDNAKEFAAKYGMKKAYDSLDDMLADEDIEIVYIASPNALHYPQAKKALEAKKNVVLEKPFTSTLEQAKDLFETAEKNGVMIFEAITNIHTPNFGLLKDNLPMAGKLRQITLNFSQYSSKYDKYKAGIITSAFNPEMDGGALGDLNIYNMHLCVGLFGKPEAITYYPVLGYNGVDTSGTLILEYPTFNAVCIGAKDSSSDYLFLLQGEEGTFQIDQASSGVLKHITFIPSHRPDVKTEPQLISIDQGPHMTYEFMDFITALLEKNQNMYEKFKDETLTVMELYQEGKNQRDAKKA